MGLSRPLFDTSFSFSGSWLSVRVFCEHTYIAWWWQWWWWWWWWWWWLLCVNAGVIQYICMHAYQCIHSCMHVYIRTCMLCPSVRQHSPCCGIMSYSLETALRAHQQDTSTWTLDENKLVTFMSVHSPSEHDWGTSLVSFLRFAMLCSISMKSCWLVKAVI